MRKIHRGRSYCGRKNPSHLTDGIRYVDCSECIAAYNADATNREDGSER